MGLETGMQFTWNAGCGTNEELDARLDNYQFSSHNSITRNYNNSQLWERICSVNSTSGGSFTSNHCLHLRSSKASRDRVNISNAAPGACPTRRHFVQPDSVSIILARKKGALG